MISPSTFYGLIRRGVDSSSSFRSFQTVLKCRVFSDSSAVLFTCNYRIQSRTSSFPYSPFLTLLDLFNNSNQ